MTKILLLSDTHSYTDERILEYAGNADEIWHAGDFGVGVAEKLAAKKKLRGVFGNIDDASLRREYPEYLFFETENTPVLMQHIGGYPNKYAASAQERIEKYRPKIFISGHSHILKVMHDQKYQLLHLNPGAAGKTGWHQLRTMLRFTLNNGSIDHLEVIELGKK